MMLTDELVAAWLAELQAYTAADLAAVALTREPVPPADEEGETEDD